jgi:hypothetical protein
MELVRAAGDTGEIEITPAMIRAGVWALGYEQLAGSSDDETVNAIFREMAAKLPAPPRADHPPDDQAL